LPFLSSSSSCLVSFRRRGGGGGGGDMTRCDTLQTQNIKVIGEYQPVATNLPSALSRLHSQLKALAQVHVVLGLVLLILGALADYVSSRINSFRLYGLHEVCALYFILCGVIGICGSASHRRGLLIAYLVMGIHSAAIFAPIIVIVSSFDIHFYQHECWGECDWHLLAPRLSQNSRCQILCGEHVDDFRRGTMTRLGTDYRLDAGMIAGACLEILLAILTVALCIRGICNVRGFISIPPATEMMTITKPEVDQRISS